MLNYAYNNFFNQRYILHIMATNSTEQKLAKIFSEQFQIKRLMKQISDLKQLRQKGSQQIKMSVLRNQCLIFKVQLLATAYKNTKLPEVLTKIPFDFKIIVRNNYPANPPRLYFMNNNMTRYGFKPFRDYLPQLLGKIQQWSAKITIQQLIKSIPSFLQKVFVDKSIIQRQKFPIFQDYFQIDSIYSWKFCQLYPIKLLRRQVTKQGFMYIDISEPQIIILEDVGMEAPISICDYIRGSEILSLRKKKNTSNQFILQTKLNYNTMSGKYAIEFFCQDYQALLIAIMDCAKVIQVGRKTSEGQIKKGESSSQQQQQQIDNQKASTKKDNNSQVPGSIQELVQQILIYESLVDNKMTSQNLSQLVTLLQKAIQYYSAKSDERFTIYLNKLQAILSNEMAQALLQSTNQEKKRKNNSKTTQIKKDQYKSIVDLL